ncbi:MAG: thioredoxin-disulfide reductase [Bacilli bacterium]
MKKQVAIIGSGPSGICAAIYLVRGGITPVIFEKGMPGGKLPLTYKISNYPGFKEIIGADLALQMIDQLTELNVNIEYDNVKEIKQVDKQFKVITENNDYLFDAVLIASGTQDRKLNIPGEEEFYGHGVSNCAVCDGSFFKGRPMALIGGGNSSLEEALYLATITDKVYIVHRREEFRADSILVDKIKDNPSIIIKTPYIPLQIKGEKSVSSLLLKNVKTGEDEEIEVSAIFSYIGADPNTSFIDDKIKDEKGYIITNKNMETAIEGIFACGDCTQKELRQIVTAVGDGAIAATTILKYLQK